jgi:hypothetical protein
LIAKIVLAFDIGGEFFDFKFVLIAAENFAELGVERVVNICICVAAKSAKIFTQNIGCCEFRFIQIADTFANTLC